MINSTSSGSCVDQTRFDPRRSAESEQTLLDTLPGALAALRDRPEVSVELGTTSFKVSRSRLEKAGQKITSAINAKAGALSIDESLSVFPGIAFDAVASIDSLTATGEDLLLDHSDDQPLTRISKRRTASAVTPADESADTSASGDAMTAPAASDKIDKTMVTASAVQGAQPTHVLIDAVAHRIADTDEQGLGFGVIKRDGVPCIDEALRDRINVLSVSGSHDRLTVGSRLYRNDGKEAVLIIVES